MKTNITDTPKRIKKLTLALDALYGAGADIPDRYRSKSGDDTLNAQRNLDGRCHYVDADTLRFHKSRVIAAHDDCEGLVFLILTSDAADPEARRRVYRVVAFDLFGDTIFRETLDNSAATSDGARKRFEAFSLNLTDHYRKAFTRRRDQLARDLGAIKTALRTLGKAPSTPATPADPTPAN